MHIKDFLLVEAILSSSSRSPRILSQFLKALIQWLQIDFLIIFELGLEYDISNALLQY